MFDISLGSLATIRRIGVPCFGWMGSGGDSLLGRVWSDDGPELVGAAREGRNGFACDGLEKRRTGFAAPWVLKDRVGGRMGKKDAFGEGGVLEVVERGDRSHGRRRGTFVALSGFEEGISGLMRGNG